MFGRDVTDTVQEFRPGFFIHCMAQVLFRWLLFNWLLIIFQILQILCLFFKEKIFDLVSTVEIMSCNAKNKFVQVVPDELKRRDSRKEKQNLQKIQTEKTSGLARKRPMTIRYELIC